MCRQREREQTAPYLRDLDAEVVRHVVLLEQLARLHDAVGQRDLLGVILGAAGPHEIHTIWEGGAKGASQLVRPFVCARLHACIP